MNMKERRAQTIAELTEAVAAEKRSLAKLRIERGVGQMGKPHEFRKSRREAARILTVLNEHLSRGVVHDE
jgi:large subunit ribosomal protein L29